ncbi:uncharacterized protein LOC142170295 [Nicotiana tabacum]|uniref:Uncharacterized protein LOC142170295 n=1 Tax=Nicotiana tabacum TaxID=4097 RepID=A0AC58STI7_TOBAC
MERRSNGPVKEGVSQTKQAEETSYMGKTVDKGKAIKDRIELDIVNFSALSPITMRNSFEPLNKGSWFTSNIPPNKGEGIQHGHVITTQSNKQSDTKRISSRIDRAFGNYEWMMQWGHVITEYGLSYISDHSPMLITLHSASKPGKTPIRFFNVWADHDSFISIVERAWNQSYTIGKKTSGMKIEQTRISLEEVQQKINAAYNDTLIEEDKRLLHNLEKWSLIVESVLRQKARTKWIKLEDSNTKYFAAVMKERSQRKQVNELMSITEDKLIHPESIKQEVKLALCGKVTGKEIYTGLCAINSDKVPTIDGYNAYFFKKAWLNGVFLEQVMIEMGFLARFVNWIMGCVTTVNYTIMVNGEHTSPFDVAKGLRQGDPISSFLFAIVMEYLSRSLNKLNEVKGFKFHPRCSKLGITHLSYADDLLLFARGFLNFISHRHDCFNHFSQVYGLQANLKKSSVYFGGVQQSTRLEIIQKLGYTTGELPFKYLGIPLTTTNFL